MKKILSAFLMAGLIFLAGTVSAATSVEVQEVAVIVEPPVESFSKSEEVFNSIQQTVDKIFKNTTNFNVQSIDETAGYIQIYREENNFASNEDSFLKKADLDEVCQHLGSDFIIYMRVSGTEQKITGIGDYIINGGSADSAKVVLDFRVWSNDKKDFTYSKRITKTDYTLERSLSKCLQEVEKDAGKVRAAM